MALHRRLEVLGFAVLGIAAIWSMARRPRSALPVQSARLDVAPLDVAPLEFAPPLDPLVPSPSARRLLRWCEVERVLERKCQRCHGMPLTNGAPFPLTSHADTEREHPPGSNETVADRMLRVVRHRIMPPSSMPIEPPVEPLDAREADVLMAWLEEGALPFGRKDCKSP